MQSLRRKTFLFLVGKDPCDFSAPWYGLEDGDGAPCHDTIHQIFMLANNLQGNLPDVFDQFASLTSLSLVTSLKVRGTIPPSVFQIPLLTSLRLSNLSLKGTIPSTIGNATRLITFSVEDNLLSGSLPTEIVSLTQIKVYTIYIYIYIHI